MMTIKLATALLVTAALAGTPFAAQAKKHKRTTHYVSTMQAPAYSGSSGVTATQPATTYGTSGRSVGTVTAPSVGSYYWPSVGVTNAVPTWSNTGPK